MLHVRRDISRSRCEPLEILVTATECQAICWAVITDAVLQTLAASKSLKKLSLSGLKQITPAGIDQLQQARPAWVIQSQ